MKRKELSLWLKGIVVVFAVLVAAIFFGILPILGTEMAAEMPYYADYYYPVMIFLWFSLVPVYIILIIAWQIFSEIGNDNSYCTGNARRLKNISKLALLESVLFMLGLMALLIFRVIHPGVIMLTLFLIAIGAAFCVVTASLSHIVAKNCAAAAGEPKTEEHT